MPKYLGPYDVLVVDGKEYHQGENVNVSKERVAQIKATAAHRFEGDEDIPAVAVFQGEREQAHAPNELGVPEAPAQGRIAASPPVPPSD